MSGSPLRRAPAQGSKLSRLQSAREADAGEPVQLVDDDPTATMLLGD
jgi:hypothetical protein